MLLAWYRNALRTTGVKPAEISRRTGITADVLSKVQKTRRKLQFDEALKIAAALGIDPPAAKMAPEPQISEIEVVGEVAAGAFLDVTNSDFVPFFMQYASAQRWPMGSVKALIVRGESINRMASDGDRIAYLAFDAAPRGYRDGDWVVVERERGGLIETTVKRIRQSIEGAWQLWPESDHPSHQVPIALGEHDKDVVRVIGFVLDFIRPATTF